MHSNKKKNKKNKQIKTNKYHADGRYNAATDGLTEYTKQKTKTPPFTLGPPPHHINTHKKGGQK
jgi:hypothetical protein